MVTSGPPSRSTAAPARIGFVLPALNEEQAIARVLDELQPSKFARVVVVDNGSTDATAAVARAHGADVAEEPRRGYGQACQRGLGELAGSVDVVVFMDADGSDVPAEAELLLRPLLAGEADVVIGSRVRGHAEQGSLRLLQRWGNRLAVAMIRWLYGYRYTDLGPFRAIRWTSLEALEMRDLNFGWTAEMQVKALKKGLRVREVPVSYRARVGKSKISGTVSGSVQAGFKILCTILRLRFGN